MTLGQEFQAFANTLREETPCFRDPEGPWLYQRHRHVSLLVEHVATYGHQTVKNL